jgi:hypothetical protein
MMELSTAEALGKTFPLAASAKNIYRVSLEIYIPIYCSYLN